MDFDYQSTWSDWDPWSPIPPRYNLGVALTAGQVAQGHADRPALHWENVAGDSRTLTYSQIDALSNRLAASLAALGVNRGDRVFLRLPNIPEFYIAALGIAKLGAVFIPSSTQFRLSEVQYRLQDSGAVAAIATTELVGVIEEASPYCRDLKHIITTAYPAGGRISPSHLDFSQLVDDSVSTASWQPADTANDDVAFLAYTSGTTGDPKGVVHYHRYPIAYEGLVRHWHNYRPGEVVACPSELGWLLPVASTFLYAMSRGLTVVLFDAMGQRFDPLAWFKLFQKYKINNFTAPPTVYRMLMTVGEQANEFDLSSLRHAVTAGEPLPSDTLAAIRRQLGVTPLDGIGMSECMVYCFNMVGMPLKPGSCGRPGPGTVIQLMDDEMNLVPQGSDGILCLKRDTHPGMMKEYWNKPDRTAEVFRGEWYVSGDVLSMDSDGYYWFKGRADDVIKASGYRISPFEVESCLLEHPAVLEAAVVASPDPLRGTVIKAFIVPRQGFEPGDALAADVQDFVRRTAAPYKCPRKLEFLTALPKTTSGKIKRGDLRQREHESP